MIELAFLVLIPHPLTISLLIWRIIYIKIYYKRLAVNMPYSRLVILAIMCLAPARLIGAVPEEDDPLEDLPIGGYQAQVARQEFAFNAIASLLGGGDIFPPWPSQNEGDEQSGEIPAIPSTPEIFDACRADITGNPIIEMADRLDNNYTLEVIRDEADGGRAFHFANGRKYWVEWGAERIVSKHTHPRQMLGGLTVPEIKKEPRRSMLDAIGNTSSIVTLDDQGRATVRDGTVSAQLSHILSEFESLKEAIPTSPLHDMIALVNLNATNIARLTNQIETLEAYMHRSVDLLARRINQTLLLMTRRYNAHIPLSNRITPFSEVDTMLPVPPSWMPDDHH